MYEEVILSLSTMDRKKYLITSGVHQISTFSSYVYAFVMGYRQWST